VCSQPKGIKLKFTEYKLRKMARSITAKRSQTSVKKGTTRTGMSLWRNSPYFKQRQEISCIPTGHLQCCIHMYPPPSSCGLRTLVNACTIKHHHSRLLHIIFFCTLLIPFNYHVFCNFPNLYAIIQHIFQHFSLYARSENDSCDIMHISHYFSP